MADETIDRCDLCNSETGIDWEWTTPCTVATAEEAQAGEGFWCEDPVWHICDTCHRMVLADKQDSVLMRAYMNINVNGIWLAPDEFNVYHQTDAREQINTVHRMFWLYKTTHQRREG